MPQNHAMNLNNLPLWTATGARPFRAKDRDDALLYAKHCGYDSQSVTRLAPVNDDATSQVTPRKTG